MNTYWKADVCWFFSKKNPRWLLSNMAGQMPVYWPMFKDSYFHWNSSEQLYQASKYGTDVRCLPKSGRGDPCVRRRIRAKKHGMHAKMTQKSANKLGLYRSDWESGTNLKSMLWVLELKLYWNPETFGAALKATGRKTIVEISRKDQFWGCKDIGGGRLQGENQLGRLLMDVRRRMPQIIKGKLTYTDGFLLP